MGSTCCKKSCQRRAHGAKLLQTKWTGAYCSNLCKLCFDNYPVIVYREKCKERLQSGAYTPLQFVKAICHSLDTLAQNILGRVEALEEGEEEVGAQAPAAHPVQGVPPHALRCIICFGNRGKTMSFVPCGHSGACELCCAVLEALDNPCPVCRGRVLSTIEVFIV